MYEYINGGNTKHVKAKCIDLILKWLNSANKATIPVMQRTRPPRDAHALYPFQVKYKTL